MLCLLWCVNVFVWFVVVSVDVASVEVVCVVVLVVFVIVFVDVAFDCVRVAVGFVIVYCCVLLFSLIMLFMI